MNRAVQKPNLTQIQAAAGTSAAADMHSLLRLPDGSATRLKVRSLVGFGRCVQYYLYYLYYGDLLKLEST